MIARNLGSTGLKIAPLVLGGNVFGWTADKETSFAILDAFLDTGFNAIDTADVYNRYAPGLHGGESETIIGEWMASRGVRDRVVLITKGGLEMGEGLKGLGRAYLKQACDASLRRLRTDYLDVYMSHLADENTPIEETLEAHADLIADGKVRHAGCSNYSAAQLGAALGAAGGSRAAYEVFEPHYNLIERSKYEGAVEEVCVGNGLGVIAYYALEAGFLTGKYRRQEDLAGSARSRMVSQHLTPRGLAVLATLDEIAKRHGAALSQVALAWVMARPSVAAPIASATSLAQLHTIMGSVALTLDKDDLDAINGAGTQSNVEHQGAGAA